MVTDQTPSLSSEVLCRCVNSFAALHKLSLMAFACCTGGGTILPGRTTGSSTGGRAGGRASRGQYAGVQGDHIDPRGNPAHATHFGAILGGAGGRDSTLQPGVSSGNALTISGNSCVSRLCAKANDAKVTWLPVIVMYAALPFWPRRLGMCSVIH